MAASTVSNASAIQVERVQGSGADVAFGLIEEFYEAIKVVVRDDRAVLQSYVSDPNGGIWVAYCDGHPAGCIALRTQSKEEAAGEVKRMFVRPAYRGKGIALQLLAELEAFAAARGFRRLYLDTKDDLREAIQFYKRTGYELCERYNENPQATIFMRKALTETVTVREFRLGDEEAFCRLNEAWIEKYFKLEEKDRQILREPEKYILAAGGQIYMAERAGMAVGCCALIPMEGGVFEVSKMGVAEAERGRGIGRRMLERVISEARQRRIAGLYLETNSMLRNAIHLYESAGFRHVPEERLMPSPYQRANVFMEMTL